MARTQRIPDTFAGQGAVRQHGGSLPVYRCNACGREVVWCESKRTGRHYLVNVSRGYMDQRFYVGSNVHPRNCAQLQAERLAAYAEHQEQYKQVMAFAELPNEYRMVGFEIIRILCFGPDRA
jgi:hypothetical protein